MRIPGILWLTLACLPLSLEASAAGSPERGGTSVVAGIGDAAGRTAPDRDSRTTVVGSGKGGGLKDQDAMVAVTPRRGSATPQRGVGQLANSNADRLHSLLSAKARTRIAKASSRVGSNDVATGNRVVRGPRSASPMDQPTPPVSKFGARAVASVKLVAKDSRVGPPHAAGWGRLGGPAIGRTPNRAAIDGTQLHRRF
jgi:hypothetical protein